MPDAADAAARLVEARADQPGADGVCLVDAEGRKQWLAAIYSREAIEGAIQDLGNDVAGASMRRLAASVEPIAVPDGGSTHDIDTWSDLAGARSREQEDRTMTEPQSPETLDRWLAALATELGIDPSSVPVGDVLNLARDVAHGVARPAAPLSTFVVGLAVGAGNGTLADLSARVSALAEEWSSEGTTSSPE